MSFPHGTSNFAAMKVAGFTFIRNAVRYDYPVAEAIQSILPVCDYFVVAVGKSDDGTLELVRSIGDPKIHIVETEWNDSLREGGRVLAEETNKAFDAIPPEYDWCFYIQADECVHEADLPIIRAGMERWLHDPQTEGLLFDYRHFYGSYDYIGVSRRWYRREVRIIRNDKRIRSYRDAQGFRRNPSPDPSPEGRGDVVRVVPGSASPLPSGEGSGEGLRKLRVRRLPACIYHYGWVKNPAAQQRKQQGFNRLWHSDDVVEQMVGDKAVYHYDGAEPLERFTGKHPAVMQPRIQVMNWQFSGDPTQATWSLKDRLSNWIEKRSGWRPGEYRNYVLLSDEQL
jgi:hypothetical protein